MKTLFLCLLSFVFGIVVSVAAFMSPGNGPMVLGYNVMMPKSEFLKMVLEKDELRDRVIQSEAELEVTKTKWYNQAGEWVEDLF